MTRLVVLAGLFLAIAPTPTASAAYAPGATVASVAGTQLGDGTSGAVVVSDDGRYVAFSTDAPALLGESPDPAYEHTRGFVRKELATGELELVAPPERRRVSDGQLVGELSGELSISADGRYVLFGTSGRLVSADGNLATDDVYVRDMTRPYSEPDAYELVSSLDGDARTPSYGRLADGSRPGRRGQSLSDNGRTALFVTVGPTDLPAGGAASPGQVLVRELDSKRTRLVTRHIADPSEHGTPVEMPPENAFAPQPVLSGDGSVVVWNANAPVRLTTLLPGEPAGRVRLLWRDLRAPASPARQVSGISDRDDPACPADQLYVFDEAAAGACYGPFARGEQSQFNPGGGDDLSASPLLPSVSDDGSIVAFISGAPLRPFDPASVRKAAYVVDMSPGLSRKAALRAVASTPSTASGIDEISLSGNGQQLAFTSEDRQFDGPRPLGGFPTSGDKTTNVYAVDLAAGTVERVTRAPDESDYLGRFDPNQSARVDPLAGTLSLSDDGGVIAFAAGDGNLFVGDVNQRTDVMVVRRAPTSEGGTVPAPLPPATSAQAATHPVRPLRPRFTVVGFPRVGRSGVASLRVRVPAAGKLRVRATAGRTPVDRDIRRVKRAATVTVRIVPGKAARRALARGRKLRVRARVTFDPARAAPTSVTRSYTLDRRHRG